MEENNKLTLFRICVESSILTLAQIETWAQNVLSNAEIIREDYILELCSATRLGINETVHVLKQNEAGIANPEIWKIAFGIAGILYETKRIDLKRACYFISKVANECNYKTEYDLFGMGLDDSYYLADNGISGNLNHTQKEFIAITEPYKNSARVFLHENFKD